MHSLWYDNPLENELRVRSNPNDILHM